VYLSSFILRLTALIFLAELSIMLVLYVTPAEEFLSFHFDNSIGNVSFAVLDSALLILFSGPPMYYWVVRPYVLARDKAEQALRASEERFRSVFDNSPSAIFLKDREGRFRLVNPQFEKWYGVPAADVIGKTSYDIYPKAYADMFVGLEREAMAAGETRERELQIPFADGREYTAILTKFPVRGADGQMIGVGTINTDITERKRLEERLRQSQKMQAIGQLAGGVAHEFNNLLMAILGCTELLEEKLQDDKSQRRYAETIKNAALRGGRLAHQLVSYSRKRPLFPKAVDLNELVLGMATMLRPILGETIEFGTEFGEDLWATKADPGGLQDVILNLAINSRDAMPEGGRLTIGTENLCLDEAQFGDDLDLKPGDYVVLVVRDTGCGMGPEVIERAFDPFFTTKDVGEGTGLGLSMVHGFAKQSGGFVRIESEQGQGTTVTFFLPRTGEEREADAPEAGQDVPKGSETVLVVEDEAEVRMVAARLLADLGYEVVEAQDGEAALAILEGGRAIDLLFTDVIMPSGMSGWRLGKDACRLHPGLKVLFTTGYGTAAAKGGEIDSDLPVLDKPYRRHELAQAVRKVMDASEAGR
jgi:PAS domain S-box-containing protein